MAQYWVKLSSGWLDLGRVGFVSETTGGGLSLFATTDTSESPTQQLTDADADAVRAYLDAQAVNKPQASRQLQRRKMPPY